MTPPAHSEEVERLISLTFGNFNDGIHATGIIDDPDFLRLRWQYQRRRNLALLAIRPEGFEFDIELTDGEDIVQRRPVILLTPPDYVAIQRPNGLWTRVERDETVHGPAPYTEDFYRQYLIDNNLPLWFMSPQHLSMARDNTESNNLGMRNEASITEEVARNYLNARYPTTPRFPIPQNHMYAVNVGSNDIARVARMFPAVAASAAAKHYLIFVLPSGHIVIRSLAESVDVGAGELLLPRIDWQAEDGQKAVSSYVIQDPAEHGGTHDGYQSPTIPFNVTPRDRTAEVAAWKAAGGFVDIGQVPWGLGRWDWLDPDIDEPLARALGLPTPLEVTIAVQNGRLQVATRHLPRVVFRPDPQYFNPVRQPTPHGYWEYFTTLGDGTSQQLAEINFGGQAPFFINTPRPTAEDIQNLREYYQDRIAAGEMDDDPTESIDIVWVPTSPPAPPSTLQIQRVSSHARYLTDDNEESEGNEADQESDGQEESEDEDEYEGQTNRHAVDPITGLTHEPRNRGENDQTGVPVSALYQTRMIGCQKYTVDRSRAHAGHPEPHKSHVCLSNGQWKQWGKYHTLDWDDKDLVEKMNKWREQVYKRNGWPPKRAQRRPDYSDEQRQWMFDLVVQAGGKKPTTRMEDIAREFNRRFGTAREVNGISALLDRTKREFDDNAGQMKPRRRRGENKKDEAAKRRSTMSKVASDKESEEDDQQ